MGLGLRLGWGQWRMVVSVTGCAEVILSITNIYLIIDVCVCVCVCVCV